MVVAYESIYKWFVIFLLSESVINIKHGRKQK